MTLSRDICKPIKEIYNQLSTQTNTIGTYANTRIGATYYEGSDTKIIYRTVWIIKRNAARCKGRPEVE